jgi:putative ABC transport system permease protein
VLLCLTGAAAGIIAAVLLEPGMNADLGAFIGHFEMSPVSAVQAVGLAILLSLIVGVPPALAARRRSIVDGLREG